MGRTFLHLALYYRLAEERAAGPPGASQASAKVIVAEAEIATTPDRIRLTLMRSQNGCGRLRRRAAAPGPLHDAQVASPPRRPARTVGVEGRGLPVSADTNSPPWVRAGAETAGQLTAIRCVAPRSVFGPCFNVPCFPPARAVCRGRQRLNTKRTCFSSGRAPASAASQATGVVPASRHPSGGVRCRA